MAHHPPIVIGGARRSGTTLLQSIVGSHPDVAMFYSDPPWWTDYYGALRYRDLGADPAVLCCLLDDILNTKKLRSMAVPIDRAALEAQLAALERVTFGAVLRAILEQNAGHYHKPRWGLKTPGNELFADAIFAAWPDARMVQLIRDPRDVLVSARSRGWRQSAVFNMIRWNQSTRAAARNLAAYPGAYRVIRYEDLVAQPEAVVRAVCVFLGLDYQPAMLESFAQPGWGGHNSMFADVSTHGISQAPVGRYVKLLPPGDVAICNTMAGRWMARHGYATDTVSIPLRDRLAAWTRIASAWTYWRGRAAARALAIRAGLHDPLRSLCGPAVSSLRDIRRKRHSPRRPNAD